MLSIIIPAHNEEKVIAATLNQLVGGAASGEIEVIVVCNGCTDNTVQIVRSFGPAIKCIETEVPSKSKALNLGDTVASGFPRFYQDADVVLTLEAIRQVAQVLQTDEFLAAAPRMKMDVRNSTWPVRAYYEVWQKLPYVREGMIGTGVYAISEQGRKKFSMFPQIIADDGYIRALFQSQERTIVNSCHSLVRAPASLEGLLTIKTRSRLGMYELKEKFPELLRNEKKEYGKALIDLLSQFHLWPKMPIYLAVNLLTRFQANRRAQIQGFSGWQRDESSRNYR